MKPILGPGGRRGKEVEVGVDVAMLVSEGRGALRESKTAIVFFAVCTDFLRRGERRIRVAFLQQVNSMDRYFARYVVRSGDGEGLVPRRVESGTAGSGHIGGRRVGGGERVCEK